VLRRTVAVTLTILVTLVIGELMVRAFHHFNPLFVFPDDSYNRFRGKPFAEDYDFKLNSHGFKDVEYTNEKPAGVIRILGIGDSFTFGVVPYRHHFLTLLEDQLKGSGHRVELINLGIPSTGPSEYVQIFRQEGLPLDPDVALVSFFVGNDFQVEDTKPPRSYLWALLRFAVSARRNWNGNVIHGASEYQDSAPSLDADKYLQIEVARSRIFRLPDSELSASLANVMPYLLQLQAIAAQRNIALSVAIIPDEVQVNRELQRRVTAADPSPGGWDFTLPNRLLAAELKRNHIDCIDLLDEFVAASSSANLYKPQDSHWNIEGNRLAAAVLERHLAPRLRAKQ
jgi:hypothetical protein